jgi:hypothetical protein
MHRGVEFFGEEGGWVELAGGLVVEIVFQRAAELAGSDLRRDLRIGFEIPGGVEIGGEAGGGAGGAVFGKELRERAGLREIRAGAGGGEEFWVEEQVAGAEFPVAGGQIVVVDIGEAGLVEPGACEIGIAGEVEALREQPVGRAVEKADAEVVGEAGDEDAGGDLRRDVLVDGDVPGFGEIRVGRMAAGGADGEVVVFQRRVRRGGVGQRGRVARAVEDRIEIGPDTAGLDRALLVQDGDFL